MICAKAFKASIFGILFLQDPGVLARTPSDDTLAANAFRSSSPAATIQHGMELHCQFVADSRPVRKGSGPSGNLGTKADIEKFQFRVDDGNLVLAGNAGIDRLRAIANAPGESAFFVEDTASGNIALWSFYRVKAGSIAAVNKISIRDLGVSDIRILSTAANCTVTGGDGIAVTR
jgi:hypothetical protein